jgi:hypothetical protein
MNNLNKQYALLGYNINIVKDIVKTMDDKKILPLLPKITLPKNTLLHYTTKQHDDIILGVTHKDDDEQFLPYSYNIPNPIDLVPLKHNVDIILTNDKELQLLDVTNVSIELGFNPLYFYINDTLYQTDEDIIYDYCKKHKLDGYINLNKPITLNEFNQCPYFIHNDVQSICPTIYLIKNEVVKTRGVIELTNKNKKYLTEQELTKLYNVLFCNLSYLIENLNDVKTKPVIDNHIIIFYDNEKPYDFTKIYQNKDYLDALTINYTNLKDECDFDCCGHMIEIKSVNPPKNVDIYVDYEIDVNASKKLFKTILSDISDKNNINSFLFQNYDKIATIKGYENLINLISGSNSIEQVGYIINELEKNIINTLYTNYKSSPKSYKNTVNFINLQYLPTTFQYLSSKIMDVLSSISTDDVVKIIQGEINKTIVQYFNIDYLMIDMNYKLYKKPSKLYQDLLNDVTKYKQEPVINLDYVKTILRLNDDEDTKNNIKQVYNDIYDIYKTFLKGTIQFNKLYHLLKVNELHNALFNFTQQYNLNVSLIMNYNELSSLPDMEQYNLDTLKELSLEEYEELLDELKLHIIKTKLLQQLSQFFALNKDKSLVKNFLDTNINRIVNNYLSNKDSDFNMFLQNTEADFYKFMISNIDISTIVKDIINYNTNDVMIDYIYNQLKIPLINKQKILKFVKNKNLFDIYLSYLRSEITKVDLEKAIFVNLNKEEKEEKEKEKKEKKDREEIEVERSVKSTKRKASK